MPPHVATLLDKAVTIKDCLTRTLAMNTRMHIVCVTRPAVNASVQLPVYADLAENVLQPVDGRYQRLSQAFQMPR